MITFAKADGAQKAAVLNILVSTLDAIGCGNNFKIFPTKENIAIRQSVSNPPTAEQIDRFKSTITKLKVFNAKYKSTHVAGLFKKPVTFYHVSLTINEVVLAEMIAKNIIKLPLDLSVKSWYLLPLSIQLRWNRFNPELQQHIDTCTLNSKSAVVKIPVRLALITPQISIIKNETDRLYVTYDLYDLLTIKERHPKDETLRLHPLPPKRYFSIDLILPARLEPTVNIELVDANDCQQQKRQCI